MTIGIDHLSAIPSDISTHILFHLSWSDICSVSQLSHRWKNLTDSYETKAEKLFSLFPTSFQNLINQSCGINATYVKKFTYLEHRENALYGKDRDGRYLTYPKLKPLSPPSPNTKQLLVSFSNQIGQLAYIDEGHYLKVQDIDNQYNILASYKPEKPFPTSTKDIILEYDRLQQHPTSLCCSYGCIEAGGIRNLNFVWPDLSVAYMQYYNSAFTNYEYSHHLAGTLIPLLDKILVLSHELIDRQKSCNKNQYKTLIYSISTKKFLAKIDGMILGIDDRNCFEPNTLLFQHNKIKLFDLSGCKMLKENFLYPSAEQLFSASITSKTIITLNEDNRCQIWDRQSGNLLRTSTPILPAVSQQPKSLIKLQNFIFVYEQFNNCPYKECYPPIDSKIARISPNNGEKIYSQDYLKGHFCFIKSNGNIVKNIPLLAFSGKQGNNIVLFDVDSGKQINVLQESYPISKISIFGLHTLVTHSPTAIITFWDTRDFTIKRSLSLKESLSTFSIPGSFDSYLILDKLFIHQQSQPAPLHLSRGSNYILEFVKPKKRINDEILSSESIAATDFTTDTPPCLIQ
ncbi:MAG: hypothetical protein K0S74_1779 [Chlamydiales bacterium]|jgi:hypothetical protein|nr:hypothetical protein [Chlamydiales bacterium]